MTGYQGRTKATAKTHTNVQCMRALQFVYIHTTYTYHCQRYSPAVQGTQVVVDYLQMQGTQVVVDHLQMQGTQVVVDHLQMQGAPVQSLHNMKWWISMFT
jgi:hypothetical protein